MWLPLSIFFERPRAFFFENFIKFMFGKSKRVNLKFWAVCSVLKQVPVVPWTIQVAALMTQAAAIPMIWVPSVTLPLPLRLPQRLPCRLSPLL